MITLNIQKYCHECPDFEADVRKQDTADFHIGHVWHDTLISCAHRNRCYEIKKYLENKENENV